MSPPTFLFCKNPNSECQDREGRKKWLSYFVQIQRVSARRQTRDLNYSQSQTLQPLIYSSPTHPDNCWQTCTLPIIRLCLLDVWESRQQAASVVWLLSMRTNLVWVQYRSKAQLKNKVELPGWPSLKWVSGKMYWESEASRHIYLITRRVPIGLWKI